MLQPCLSFQSGLSSQCQPKTCRNSSLRRASPSLRVGEIHSCRSRSHLTRKKQTFWISAESSRRNPAVASSPQLDLVLALAQAAGRQQMQFLQETLLAGSEAMSSFQKSLEPLPKGFPPGPEGDVAIDLVADPLAFTTQAARKHGGLVGLRIAGQNVVLVSDPLLAKRVLIEDSQSYQKEGTAFFPNSSLTGNGLLVSDGEVWQRQRRLSNPAFRQAAVNSYSSAISQAAERLVHRRWRAGGARDVYADFNDLSLQVGPLR